MNLLLESGADINARNSNDESPLDLAAISGKLEVASFLAEKMGVALPEIASPAKGTDANEPPPEGGNNESVDSSPVKEEAMTLHTASKEGRLDVVRNFLDGGADVDTRNDDYDTPLQLASNGGHLEVVRLLIDRGADVNCRNQDGWTPLHEASWEDHLDVARLLLEHGASVEAANHYRWTPLHMAASNGYDDIVRLLLERGADANTINDNGRTPAREANAGGYRDIAQLLQSKQGAHGA